MKSTLFGAAILALATSAYAQPVVDPLRTQLIEQWVKYCTGTMDTPGMKKSWTDKERSDFCSCGSVTMADRTTQAQYDAKQQLGNFPPEWWQMREDVRDYCIKKYVQTPDVTSIKNKQW
jgi:hypothetical protein